jgi:type IV pilus assembly protein PilC
MARYQYQAMDAAGRTVGGVLEAESLDSVRSKLSELRYYVISVREAKATRGMETWFRNRRGVKLRELVIFSRQFATMIDAGLSAIKCLDILQQQTTDLRMKDVIRQVKHDVGSGASLTDALARHPRIFNNLFVNMIRSAEAGGILDQVLNRLAGFLEKEQEIRNKVRSAMMYPVLVFIFAILMLLLLLFFVLPKFKEIFDTMELKLPFATRFLLGLSSFSVRYWYIVLLILVGTAVAVKLYSVTEQGRFNMDRLKLRVPVMGELLMKMSVSRFARTFGTLISSGVPVVRALEIVVETASNRVIEQAVNTARTSVRDGDKISVPLMASKIFPVMVTQMIAVGEETGRLDEMLAKVSDFYDDEVETTLKGLTSLIEPLLIVGLGVIVGFIAVSVISPIYTLVGSIQ